MKVGELIELLNSFPPDTVVGVEDADTSWFMTMIGVFETTLRDGGQPVVVMVPEGYGGDVESLTTNSYEAGIY